MKKKTFKLLAYCALIYLFMGCTGKVNTPKNNNQVFSKMQFATGFRIEQNEGFTVIHIKSPWPNAKHGFSYAFIPEENLAKISLAKNSFDAIITTPVTRLVATSTTHIPALESLNSLQCLIGFPDTKYVSSKKAREMIDKGLVKELGANERLNTEMVLELQPEVIIGFGINDDNNQFDLIQNAGIPVIFNGDWTEETPLGKAEWIKLFGVLFGKEEQAELIFDIIVADYEQAKQLAATAKSRPKVLSGALYKDVWYLPAGDSWAAQFLNDANSDYLWSNTEGTGSLALGLESVLSVGTEADFWVSPSQFTTYEEMLSANDHYTGFKAFKTKNIYTFAKTKGTTGGLLYYELAPQRPDLVLKDLVHIFHPELLPSHELYFFKPL
ncbi:MAG: ABC transporter substrate-binding protein [Croceitalea sp.]|nr:ABC transporter substrate-binding protein [Croceitalea sp.]